MKFPLRGNALLHNNDPFTRPHSICGRLYAIRDRRAGQFGNCASAGRVASLLPEKGESSGRCCTCCRSFQRPRFARPLIKDIPASQGNGTATNATEPLIPRGARARSRVRFACRLAGSVALRVLLTPSTMKPRAAPCCYGLASLLGHSGHAASPSRGVFRRRCRGSAIGVYRCGKSPNTSVQWRPPRLCAQAVHADPLGRPVGFAHPPSRSDFTRR